MNSLSEIFAGKVPGLNAPVDNVRGTVDVIEQKATAKPDLGVGTVSLQQKQIDIDSKIFGNVKGMGEFDFKGKSMDIQKKMFGAPNMQVPKGFGEFDFKGKGMDMQNKMFAKPNMKTDKVFKMFDLSGANMGMQKKMTMKSNVQTPKGFGSFDFKGSTAKVEQKLWNKTNVKTEMLGWGRMKQQRGLSLFGDVDGDKVHNVFDCQPYNKKMQAMVHEVGKYIATPTSNNNVEYTTTDVSQLPVVEATPVSSKKEPIISITARSVPSTPTEPKEKIGFLQKLGFIRKTPQEQIALAQEKTKQTQLATDLELEKIKQQGVVRGQIQKGKSLAVELSAIRKTQTPTVSSEARRALAGFRGGLAAAPIAESYKINQLIGLGGGTGLGMATMSGMGVMGGGMPRGIGMIGYPTQPQQMQMQPQQMQMQPQQMQMQPQQMQTL